MESTSGFALKMVFIPDVGGFYIGFPVEIRTKTRCSTELYDAFSIFLCSSVVQNFSIRPFFQFSLLHGRLDPFYSTFLSIFSAPRAFRFFLFNPVSIFLCSSGVQNSSNRPSFQFSLPHGRLEPFYSTFFIIFSTSRSI